MHLSIIVINYQSKDYLEKFLDSTEKYLQGIDDFDFEVILVKNDTEPLTALAKNYQLPIKIINSQKNIGFGAANNLASKQATGKYLLFINPDTQLVDSSLQEMVRLLEKFPEIGVTGPKIIEADKNLPQPWTCGKKTSLSSVLFRNSINKPWNKNESTEVDWVSGTALVLSKELFKKITGFDEKFFMYFEDQDLCLRVKDFGKKIIFFPSAKIIHFNGKSWKDEKEKKHHFYKSQDYFFEKHHNKFKTNLLKSVRRIFKNQ